MCRRVVSPSKQILVTAGESIDRRRLRKSARCEAASGTDAVGCSKCCRAQVPLLFLNGQVNWQCPLVRDKMEDECFRQRGSQVQVQLQ